ncbi:formimidoylglutamate deiminase [Nocardioides sp. GY 10127]|nr:formimidoylglutamate deiminase [Nocardioides sp. GY 10127]
MRRAWLERAWIGAGAQARVADDVLVEVADGRFTRVEAGWRPGQAPESAPAPSAPRVPGLTVPGLANAHSHAFHRALRGRTQAGRGTFWTWREQMYALAATLDPDSYRRLATAVFREMVATGVTTVGEFHYLHHRPDGGRYDDPNAMGHALVEAAAEAGLRITLLDTLYLSSGFGRAPEGAQVRYSDGDADAWLARVSDVRPADHLVVGRAYHSVRAVPRGQLRAHDPADGPLHVHLSEQVAENEACLAATGLTPTGLLAEAGALGPATSLVHATHLTDADVALLGSSGSWACFCPTTERDLGDGIGPGRALHEAGARLSLGSDSHAVVDLFEEMRALELDERLATRSRGHWSAAELLAAGTAHASLGFADAGRIEVGARADLVTLDTTSVRTAGTGADEATAVFAAGGADVVLVVVDGRVVHERGQEAEVGRQLAAAISETWAGAGA